MPLPPHNIVHIIFVGSPQKVIRIYAWRIVTTMADFPAFGASFAVDSFIGQSMRIHGLAINAQHSIPKCRSTRRPEPTSGVWLRDNEVAVALEKIFHCLITNPQ